MWVGGGGVAGGGSGFGRMGIREGCKILHM